LELGAAWWAFSLKYPEASLLSANRSPCIVFSRRRALSTFFSYRAFTTYIGEVKTEMNMFNDLVGSTVFAEKKRCWLHGF
jgi:hypothetical protein